MTIKQLVERAFDENNKTGKWELDREAIEPIVRAAIHGMGFHITATGEVGDPRPKEHVEFNYPPRNVRTYGSGRRNSGGRR